MSSQRALFIAVPVIALCRVTSPALAQDASGAPQSVSISLKPASSHLQLHLRQEGGSAQSYECAGPCVLAVAPGHYQLGVVDGQGAADWHPVDLSEAETIEVHRSHKGLTIAGIALFATGAALVAVGTGAFVYGAVSNLETMECDSACGGVSAHFLRVSAAGAGIGLVFAAVGGVLAYASSGPTMIEKPGVETAATAAKRAALSFAPSPDLHASKAPIASLKLTF